MTSLIQVNWRKHRTLWRAKDADRLGPKGTSLVNLVSHQVTRIYITTGVQPEAKSSMLVERNPLNPLSRLQGQAPSQGEAVGVAGKPSWKKRMPSGNRTDRGCNITLPCKRADFRLVNRHETASRTSEEGNRK